MVILRNLSTEKEENINISSRNQLSKIYKTQDEGRIIPYLLGSERCQFFNLIQ